MADSASGYYEERVLIVVFFEVLAISYLFLYITHDIMHLLCCSEIFSFRNIIVYRVSTCTFRPVGPSQVNSVANT